MWHSVPGPIKRRIDRLEHLADILSHIVVPETKDTIALRLKPSRSILIAFRALGFAVLGSIHFDDKSGGRTCKINDEISNRHLTSKMSAVRRKALQCTPKSSFSIRCLVTQPPRGVAFEFIDCQ